MRREEGGRRRGEGVYTRTEVKEYIGRRECGGGRRT